MVILIDTPLKRKEEGCWSMLGTRCICCFSHWRLSKIISVLEAPRNLIAKEPCLILSHCFRSGGTDRPQWWQNSEILQGSGFERIWLCLECSFSLNKLRFHEQWDWTSVGSLLPEVSTGNRLALRVCLSPNPKNSLPTVHICIHPFRTSIHPSL